MTRRQCPLCGCLELASPAAAAASPEVLAACRLCKVRGPAQSFKCQDCAWLLNSALAPAPMCKSGAVVQADPAVHVSGGARGMQPSRRRRGASGAVRGEASDPAMTSASQTPTPQPLAGAGKQSVPRWGGAPASAGTRAAGGQHNLPRTDAAATTRGGQRGTGLPGNVGRTCEMQPREADCRQRARGDHPCDEPRQAAALERHVLLGARSRRSTATFPLQAWSSAVARNMQQWLTRKT